MATSIPNVWVDIESSLLRGSTGDVKQLVNTDAIIASINDLLLTPYGSRVMRRDYPGRFIALLFEPIVDSNLAGTFQRGLQSAVTRYDDRVSIKDVKINSDRGQQLVNLEVNLYISGYEQVFTASVNIKRN